MKINRSANNNIVENKEIRPKCQDENSEKYKENETHQDQISENYEKRK